MKLIIVRGGGATGKTALALRLAKDLKYELYSKDEFKEKEFNKLRHRPTALQMKNLESKSWDLTYSAVKNAVSKNTALIIEGNFMRPQKRQIIKAINKDSVVVEVYCRARGLASFKRFVRRNESGERHRGHRDRVFYPVVFMESVVGIIGITPYKPFKLSDNFIEVDTTDFNNVDYTNILNYIKTI